MTIEAKIQLTSTELGTLWKTHISLLGRILMYDLFNIMFLRQMTKLVLGYSAIYSTMSYAKEVQDVFKITYDAVNKYYGVTTNYLLGKGGKIMIKHEWME